MVRAPHSASGGTGNNSYLGEDLDVLVDDVYSRRDELNPPGRLICRPQMAQLGIDQDRLSGNRNACLGRAQLHEGRRERPRRGR